MLSKAADEPAVGRHEIAFLLLRQSDVEAVVDADAELGKARMPWEQRNAADEVGMGVEKVCTLLNALAVDIEIVVRPQSLKGKRHRGTVCVRTLAP